MIDCFVDEMIRYVQVNQISEDEINLALLKLLLCFMRTQNADGHNLADEDGVCVLSVTRYE